MYKDIHWIYLRTRMPVASEGKKGSPTGKNGDILALGEGG